MDAKRNELLYIYENLDENGKRLLLLFARKIPQKENEAD